MKHNWNLKRARLQGILVLMSVMICAISTGMQAQCTASNTAFQGGEVLDYTLYFNWKFVWMKAGTARMEIRDTNWRGKGRLSGRTDYAHQQEARQILPHAGHSAKHTLQGHAPLLLQEGCQ